MDLYSLIRSIPIITNCFTQKCDCFQNRSEIFLFLKYIVKQVKTSPKMLTVNRIFMKQIFSGNFSSAAPSLPKKNLSRAPMALRSRSAGLSAQTYKECSKLSIFSRLDPFLQLFGQVKEQIIIEFHEMVRMSHVVACLKNFIQL